MKTIKVICRATLPDHANHEQATVRCIQRGEDGEFVFIDRDVQYE